MNSGTRIPAAAQVHRSAKICRGRVFSFVTAGQVTDALTLLALQHTWCYLHGISGSRRPT
jgi:hypothetical protein